MISTEVGVHTFGSGGAAEEPEHLRTARLHQERKTELLKLMARDMKLLEAKFREERTQLTAAYDDLFKQAAADAGLR